MGVALAGPRADPGTPAARHERWATILVATLWAVMLAVAFACIARYARNVPFAEDWTMVPALTGNEPSIVGWLWSQNNEHRVPLPRLIYLALLALGDGDFRTGMVFNTIVFGALAAALILTARRIRGHLSVVDAFFPLSLLHLGHWINMFWGWQIQFVSSAALTLALLMACARRAGPPVGARAGWVALSIGLLPFTGASGLIVAGVMGPWVLLSAWSELRGDDTRSRRSGVLLAAALAIAAATALLYFVGYERPTWNPPSPSHVATLQTAAMFLSLGWGPAVARGFAVAVLATGVLLLPTAWLVMRAAFRERGDERLRAVGLVLFGVAMTILALGIGWGRAAQLPEIGLPNRYVLFAVPALCYAFYVWQLYGTPPARRAVQGAMALIAALLLPFNTRAGLADRDWYVSNAAAVERDIASGTDAATLAARHRQFLMHWNEQALMERIRMLRDAGIEPFARVRADAPR